MVGIPGSGKSFFAQQFSRTFNAPYIDIRALAARAKTADDANKTALEFAGEIAKTKQTFVYEGSFDTYAERTDFTKWAQSNGYQPLLIWIQTDQHTAMKRTLKQYEMSREAYANLVKHFEAPRQNESAIVLSGKHTYATQAKAVLSRLTNKPTQPETAVTTPVQRPLRQTQKPERRAIIIK